VLLKDSRVDLNIPNRHGNTPLWTAARWGHTEIIKRWIASGREMDLGNPGNFNLDVLAAATVPNEWETFPPSEANELVTLLEKFKENPVETRRGVRLELGLVDEMAAEMFALVVFVSDGLLEICQGETGRTPAARFFRITSQLPLELQMVLCYRLADSPKEIIGSRDSDLAFRSLAGTLPH